MNISDYEDLGYAPSIGESSIDENEIVYSSLDSKIMIYATINTSCPPEPYFRIKIWDGKDSNVFISRLSMIQPKYIKTENEDNKNDLIDDLILEDIDLNNNNKASQEKKEGESQSFSTSNMNSLGADSSVGPKNNNNFDYVEEIDKKI